MISDMVAAVVRAGPGGMLNPNYKWWPATGAFCFARSPDTPTIAKGREPKPALRWGDLPGGRAEP